MVESTHKKSIRINKAILALSAAIIICFVVIPLFLIFRLEGNPRKTILLMICAPILGYLFYLFVYTSPAFILAYFSKGKRRENPEIEKREIIYRRVSKQYLIKQLGLIQYFKITGGINRGLNTGFEYCKDLLDREQIQKHSELKYHLLIRLYKASYMDEQYAQGAVYLEQASALKPKDFLTAFWIAEANEIQGKKDEAINAYKNLVQDFTNINSSLKRYLSDQMKRIELKGPKVPKPSAGLRYMSW